jgi:hypothetical protein
VKEAGTFNILVRIDAHLTRNPSNDDDGQQRNQNLCCENEQQVSRKVLAMMKLRGQASVARNASRSIKHSSVV